MCIAPISSLMVGICNVSQLDVVANIVFAVFFTVSDKSKAADVQLVPRGHAAVMGCSLHHAIMPPWHTHP